MAIERWLVVAAMQEYIIAMTHCLSVHLSQASVRCWNGIVIASVLHDSLMTSFLVPNILVPTECGGKNWQFSSSISSFLCFKSAVYEHS